jgi:hypothetical protein
MAAHGRALLGAAHVLVHYRFHENQLSARGEAKYSPAIIITAVSSMRSGESERRFAPRKSNSHKAPNYGSFINVNLFDGELP